MSQASDDQLGLFILGWLAMQCETDEFPVKIQSVDTDIVAAPNARGGVTILASRDSHNYFTITTESGIQYRLTITTGDTA